MQATPTPEIHTPAHLLFLISKEQPWRFNSENMNGFEDYPSSSWLTGHPLTTLQA
jgi:hypothetical protein